MCALDDDMRAAEEAYRRDVEEAAALEAEQDEPDDDYDSFLEHYDDADAFADAEAEYVRAFDKL